MTSLRHRSNVGRLAMVPTGGVLASNRLARPRITQNATAEEPCDLRQAAHSISNPRVFLQHMIGQLQSRAVENRPIIE